MIQENISTTIREYVVNEGMTLRSLFTTYCDPATFKLNTEGYVRMMRGVGFMYN